MKLEPDDSMGLMIKYSRRVTVLSDVFFIVLKFYQIETSDMKVSSSYLGTVCMYELTTSLKRSTTCPPAELRFWSCRTFADSDDI